MSSSQIIFGQLPAHTTARHAGVEGEVVAGKLLEQQSLLSGYDAAKGV